MWHRHARLGIALGLFVFVSWTATRAENAPAPSAPPQLVEGRLANGFRFVLLRHTPPRGGISVRLHVAVGSLDERDDERGYAHFVEHMAFNGTRRHPPGTLTELFQGLGLTWGADLNATTSFVQTIYKLDLPENRIDRLPDSLQLIRDYADGMTFAPAEVTQEKGVILSETRARDVNARRIAYDSIDTLYANTQVVNRHVSGLPEHIEAATADSLRAFYLRCYRPERMTLVVVGDIDPAKLSASITAEFDSMTAVGPAVPRAVAILPASPDGMQAHVLINPAGGAASIALVALGLRPEDTPDGLRVDMRQRIATTALARRMAERRAANATRFGAATSTRGTGISPHFRLHQLEVQTAPTRWTEAIDFIETELRRARVQGFTAAEVKEAVDGYLTGLRNRQHVFATTPCPAVVEEIVASVGADLRWRTPAEDVARVEEVMSELTPDEVTAALADMYPETGCRLMIRVPRPIEKGSELAIAAWNKSARQPLSAAADDAAPLAFRYSDFGKPGVVLARRGEVDLGLALATFKNGVELNVRASDLEPQRFRLQAVLGRGIADVPKQQPGLHRLAGLALEICDLGKHSTLEMGRLLRLRGVTIAFSYPDSMAAISLTGPSRELPFALSVLTALLSDLKLDPTKRTQMLSRYAAALRSQLSTPRGRARVEAFHMFSGRDPRFGVTTTATVSRYSFDDVSKWLRRSWLNGPLEIGVVGDFTADEVIAAAAATVGTLPPRADRLPATDAARLAFGVSDGITRLIKTPMPAGAAAASLFWRATMGNDPQEFRALQIAADIFEDRLRLKLREELGATYSPQANAARDRRQRDFVYVDAAITLEPEQSVPLTQRAIAIAAELAANGVTEDELTRLRAPRANTNSLHLKQPLWWLSVTTYAQSEPIVLQEARTHADGFTTITKAQVDAAARTFAKNALTSVIRADALD